MLKTEWQENCFPEKFAKCDLDPSILCLLVMALCNAPCQEL